MVQDNLKLILKEVNEKRIIELTEKLISIPSHHGLNEPEKGIGKFIYNYLCEEGLDAELIPVAGSRCNVLAGYGSGKNNEKTLMLEGHMDTVDVKNMRIDPFKAIIKDGMIYGRGAADMKGALAAMISALVALKKRGVELNGRAYFAGVIDEEFWYRGAAYLAQNGPKTRYAIVGEPTGLDIHNGHRGLVWVEVKVKGKYAHGGTPELGINAIEKMNKIITEIKEVLYPKIINRTHPVTGPSYLNLGYIHGGTQPSTVAGECILQIDRRWVPGESQDSAVREIREIITGLVSKDPELSAEVSVMDYGLGIEFPPLVCEENSLLISVLKEGSIQITGREKISHFPAWTDGSILSRDGGIETAVLGPGNLESAHSDVEFCPVRDIINAAKIYIYSILRLCG
ncbi:MAG: M20 family metallopeptidase [Bacillota bacterium]|nr:M20 family metallopeptidase [Bacillota bacterium]